MNAAELRGAPLSEASGLVFEIQRMRVDGKARHAQRKADDLLRLMRPLLVKSARAFLKGSLSVEDLVQVASIEVYKAIATYEAVTSQTFEQWSFFRARRAMKDLALLHSADVRPSHHDMRSSPSQASKRSQEIGFVAEVKVVGREANPDLTEGSDCSAGTSRGISRFQGAEHIDASVAEHPRTPEELFTSEEDKRRTVRALRTLPCVHQDIVARVWGLGHPEPQSYRAIALELGLARNYVAKVAEESLQILRLVLEE